jgi:hypothetical protein
MARPELMQEAYVQRIIGHHTTPDDCGRVFAQTRPKLAAFTHIVQLASRIVPPPSIEDIMAQTRATYDGPLVMGEDLMSFEIGDEVTVRRAERASTDNAASSLGYPSPSDRACMTGSRSIAPRGKLNSHIFG